MTNAEKHLWFFRAVTKPLLSRFGSKHCKMWRRAAGSTSRGSSCMALQGAPRLALRASLAADLNGNGKKKRAEKVENYGRHSGSHTVLLMLTSLQTAPPVEVFEDLFG